MHRTPARISLFLLFFATAAGRAQQGEDGARRPSGSEPSSPSVAVSVPHLLLGGFIGVQRNWSLGSFTTGCDCGYSEGRGFGAALGALAEYPITGSFILLAEAGYRDLSTSYTTRETRTEYIVTSGLYTQVDFERTADISLGQLALGVYGAWRIPATGMYVYAGPRLGMVLSDEIIEAESVLTPGIGYASTSGAQKSFANGSLDAVWRKNSVRADLVAGIGIDIHIRRSVVVAPRLAFAYPLTSVVKEHPSWYIPALEFSAALLFGL